MAEDQARPEPSALVQQQAQQWNQKKRGGYQPRDKV
jgi:hypothetical protein